MILRALLSLASWTVIWWALSALGQYASPRSKTFQWFFIVGILPWLPLAWIVMWLDEKLERR